jgi:hypothetical protein
MPNRFSPVRPLGKYGDIYMLTRTWHAIYQAYSIAMYALLFALLCLEFIFDDFYQNILKWSHDEPIIWIVLCCVLGLAGQMLIASKGHKASRAESAAPVDSKPQLRKSIPIYIGAVVVAGVVFLSLSLKVILIDLTSNKSIHGAAVVLVLVFSVGLALVYFKWYRSK